MGFPTGKTTYLYWMRALDSFVRLLMVLNLPLYLHQNAICYVYKEVDALRPTITLYMEPGSCFPPHVPKQVATQAWRTPYLRELIAGIVSNGWVIIEGASRCTMGDDQSRWRWLTEGDGKNDSWWSLSMITVPNILHCNSCVVYPFNQIIHWNKIMFFRWNFVTGCNGN